MAIRNPLIRLNQNGLQTIGDAHLGRVFKTNVALHRRGEYEKKQMDTFKELLFAECPDENPTGYLKVQVGDLFDKAVAVFLNKGFASFAFNRRFKWCGIQFFDKFYAGFFHFLDKTITISIFAR